MQCHVAPEMRFFLAPILFLHLTTYAALIALCSGINELKPIISAWTLIKLTPITLLFWPHHVLTAPRKAHSVIRASNSLLTQAPLCDCAVVNLFVSRCMYDLAKIAAKFIPQFVVILSGSCT